MMQRRAPLRRSTEKKSRRRGLCSIEQLVDCRIFPLRSHPHRVNDRVEDFFLAICTQEREEMVGRDDFRGYNPEMLKM